MDPLSDPEYIKDKLIKFYNCRILKNHELVDEYLFIRNGKIVDPKYSFWDEKVTPDLFFDCEQGIISPGYIDIQLNGSNGYDFSSETDIIQESVENISKAQLLMGVTSYCPTLVSSSSEVYKKVLPHLGPKKGSIENGAEILGAHLEGPFINKLKKGAHDVRVFKDAANGLSDIYDVYGKEYLKKYVKYITVAPEVEGIMDCIEPLIKETGVLVSQGHSLSTVIESEKAFEKGAKLVTHLFNAMTTFHQRDPGIVGLLGSSNNDMHYGIICDGVHVYPNSVKIAYYAHPKGAVLVTDAMCAQNLEDGEYSLGEMNAKVEGGSVYLVGTNTIAGSVAIMSDCVKNFIKFTGATVVEALEAATLHPAQSLNVADRKGTLNFGSDADILILDNDLNIKNIFVNGVMASSENVKYKSRV
ncbi:putative N-acetylglucosamine-6-phosphate deacetylase [Smittium culicis]|uniref:N-acetylglucosamine-6-phosphate deacetylase n=1 Tax=Smittium culicis TaxID=133412 RepID=A0A1R1XDG1_9FUNG|nr:putative N-acetylglucosamine-6-phosphate deacetylase [Smittium culicis]OMJ17744.1 putative N-acetylglucosamine-6-phosphate deacetylase [Smittium culicis]